MLPRGRRPIWTRWRSGRANPFIQGKPIHSVVDEVIDLYRRDRFLDQVNAAYAALRNEPGAWKDEQAERALWDKMLVKGFKDE